MRRLILSTLLLFVLAVSPGLGQTADPFVTPANLTDNVAFWKKIYTEVALTEGLVHDRDYPLIIYKKITIGKLTGRSRRGVIRNHMKKVRRSLDIINRRSPSRWGTEEKRIAALFRRHASTRHIKTASRRLRFQQGQKERFKEGVERSGAYLQYIRRVFKEYGIPLRIAYLPHVESSFNINAYSRVGAAGMWQFMRRTGRMYMTINYKVDERYDPYKATVAAAKLLTRNYKQLKSWPLAITAYNHGMESLKRAVRQTGTRDLGVIIDKYKNRRFRFASKNFYSCFLAASELGANPRRYFPDLVYDTPKQSNEIVLSSFIRPDTLSKHLGVSQEELKKLNPSLRTTVFHRRMSIPRGFRLRIPLSLTAEEARAKINGIPGSLKTSKSNDVVYYSVRRGDTLHRISRRFRVSTGTLLAANNIRRKNRIYVGQVLRIPTKSAKPAVTKAKTGSAKPTVVNPTKSGVDQTKPGSVKPTVTEVGESKPGMEPVKTAVKRAVPALKGAPKPPREEMRTAATLPDFTTFDATLYNLDVTFFPQAGTARIRVATDESLAHYADWLGTTVNRIQRLNRTRRRSLRFNQTINIPVTELTLEHFKNERLEHHMTLEEDFYNRYRVVDITTRRVKSGETLWSICNSGDEIPVWLFKKYNRHLNMDKLKRNTKIRVPVIKNK